jgi:hypothetical protein
VSWGFGSVNAGRGGARTASESSRIARRLIGQVGENRQVNAVFSKTLGVLGHAKFFEPIRNPLHCGAP